MSSERDAQGYSSYWAKNGYPSPSRTTYLYLIAESPEDLFCQRPLLTT